MFVSSASSSWGQFCEVLLNALSQNLVKKGEAIPLPTACSQHFAPFSVPDLIYIDQQCLPWRRTWPSSLAALWLAQL